MGQYQHVEVPQREIQKFHVLWLGVLDLTRLNIVSRQPNTGAQALLQDQPAFIFAEKSEMGSSTRILGKHLGKVSLLAITNGFTL